MKKQTKEKNNNLYNKILKILLVLTIIFGVALRVWGLTNKINMHMDETYSYGLTHYKNIQIADNEDIFFKKHDGKYFKDYLTLSKKDLGNLKPIYINQADDVHPPLYYLLLRIASIFTLDNFSMYTGIYLNILIYIVSSLMIIRIFKKLFNEEYGETEKENEKINIKNKRYLSLALIVLFFYSASTIFVNHALFSRMYELLNLISLVFMSKYIDILKMENISDIKNVNEIKNINEDESNNKKNKNKNKKDFISLGVITILGALTHYYFVVFVVLIYLVTIYFLLKNKRTKLLKKITITFILSGIIYLLIWPVSVLHVLDTGVENNTRYIDKLKGYIKNIDFNILILPIFVLLFELKKLIVLKDKNIFKEEKEITKNGITKNEVSGKELKIKELKQILYIFFTGSILFMLIVFKIAKFISTRYIYLALVMNMISSVSIIYLNIYEGKIFRNKNKSVIKSENENENESKSEIESENKKLNISFKNKPFILFLVFIILICILVGLNTFKNLKNKNLEFQYYNEKDFLAKVEEVKGIPLVYLFTDDEYFSLTDDIYLLSKFKTVTILPNNMTKNPKPKALEVVKDFSKFKRKDEKIFVNPNFKEDLEKYLKDGKNLILLKDESLIKDKKDKNGKKYKIEKIGEIRERKLYIVEK